MGTRTLYLHMGSPKTGSSWLQAVLAMNAELLAANGIDYPALEPLQAAGAGAITSGNGARLARAFLGDSHPIGLTGRAGTEAKEGFWRYLCGGEGRAIVSSEWLYVLDRDGFTALAALIAEAGWRACPVLYFRRQDQMAQSVYSQEVMRNHLTRTPEDFCLDYARSDPRLDYHAVMTTMSSVFGLENCHFRVYEPAELVQGRLEVDFLACTGFTEVDELRLPPRKLNVSLRRSELELIRAANAVRPRDAFNESLRDVLNCVTGVPAEGTRLLIPLEICRQIVAHFAESNAAAARNFLKREDGRLFREPLPEHEDLKDQGLSPEVLAAVLIGALAMLDRRLHAMEERLARLVTG